jgi:hypothetical protein
MAGASPAITVNFRWERHAGMREAQTRNLEIPGSMLCIAPE